MKFPSTMCPVHKETFKDRINDTVMKFEGLDVTVELLDHDLTLDDVNITVITVAIENLELKPEEIIGSPIYKIIVSNEDSEFKITISHFLELTNDSKLQLCIVAASKSNTSYSCSRVENPSHFDEKTFTVKLNASADLVYVMDKKGNDMPCKIRSV